MADAAIPLAYHSPVVNDPTQVLGQAMNLRELALRAQMAPEQLQALQTENQQRQLALQQQQMDLQDQGTIRQAYIEAGGDMDKFQTLVTQRGVAPKNLMAVNNSILEMKQKTANLNLDQAKLQQIHGSMISSEAAALKQLSPDQRAAEYPNMIQRLQAAGAMSPQEAQQNLLAGVPGDARLDMTVANGMAAEQLAQKQHADIETANAKAEEARKTQLFPSELGAAQTKNQTEALNLADKQKQDAANTLSGARTWGEYERLRGELPTKVGSQFPSGAGQNPDKPVTATDAQVINRAALTPEQRAMTDYRQQGNQIRQAGLALRAQANQIRASGENRQQAVDARQAQSEIQKLEAQERTLNGLRDSLATALSVATAYQNAPDKNKVAAPYDIDEKGQSKAFNTSPRGTTDTETIVPSLTRNLQARFQNASDDLKSVIASKYQQYGRLGVAPTVPLDQVHAAIDKGTGMVLPPVAPAAAPAGGAAPAPTAPSQRPSAPAAPAKAASTNKPPAPSFTESQVRARAKAANLSPQQTEDLVNSSRSKGLIQ